MINNDEIKTQLESIKKLLVLQLVRDGVPYATIAKATGMSVKTLYKFAPKSKIKSKSEENE